MSNYYTKKDYVESDSVKNAQAAYQQQASYKPADYTSKWQTQLDDTIGKIQSREAFQYDLNADALYEQYKNQYIQQGQQAMMDTVGQASALTGGYANTYAQNSGQQAYQQYLQGLNDKIPELYQLALNKYQMEGEDLYNQYGLLSDQENQDYSRYQDAVSNWNTDMDRAWQEYLAEREYDYGMYRDQVGDDQWQESFEYQKSQDQLAWEQWLQEFNNDNSRYEQEWNYQLSQDEKATQLEAAELMAAAGDYSLLAAYYGLTEDQVKKLAGETKTGSSGSGSSGGSGGGSGANEWAEGISETSTGSGGGVSGSSYALTKNTLAGLIRNGDTAGAEKYMNMVVDQLNEKQYNELIAMFG